MAFRTLTIKRWLWEALLVKLRLSSLCWNNSIISSHYLFNLIPTRITEISWLYFILDAHIFPVVLWFAESVHKKRNFYLPWFECVSASAFASICIKLFLRYKTSWSLRTVGGRGYTQVQEKQRGSSLSHRRVRAGPDGTWKTYAPPLSTWMGLDLISGISTCPHMGRAPPRAEGWSRFTFSVPHWVKPVQAQGASQGPASGQDFPTTPAKYRSQFSLEP